ncbi:PadR family transcriptional regulator [Vibrio barjaei]|uniref:PadR family transcriptional regulator n=1 Tax=Vibrio barjaei TaxID=1676683 RepID=UPI002283AF9E|nr:PadR family transcriptional regulator [Vibrio barjaei]MCY9870346.1 PadR family transcriptional regulator [Vibrio barjaei]
MSLPYALLTQLQTQSNTGYNLAKLLSGNEEHHWHASHQQIYRELNRLYEKEMVELTYMPNEGKPDAKLYNITERGKKEVTEWSRNLPRQNQPLRDDLLIKLTNALIHNDASEEFWLGLDSMYQETKMYLGELIGKIALKRKISDDSVQKNIEVLSLTRRKFDTEAWLNQAEEIYLVAKRPVPNW